MLNFNDGKSAENKVGAISGITSDLNGEAENIAASIKAVNQLNNSLPQFIYDVDGKITGYKTRDGADTVFPFYEYNILASCLSTSSSVIGMNIPDNVNHGILICVSTRWQILSQSTPQGNGIKSLSTKYRKNTNDKSGVCVNLLSRF